MEPIRYVQSVGGYSIAYQVIGDGPLDIVFVHGFICSFQPGWEWPALASFYRRLAGMGRLILFDKRGTGLSDRVLGIASLEERMDDVRAVMDAVGAERAVVVGVSEGGPMCTLFAATHPDRCQALVTLGAYARRNWAPDYPIGRRAEQDGWLRPTAEQWGRFATERFLAERAPSIAADEEAIQWYTSYLVRGASPAAVAAITDMNEEIDVRHALGSVRVPTLVVYRAQEYLREASRYMGARLPGAQVVEVPGADHLPWEGDQGSVLAAIEHFLGGLRDDVVEPNLILTTVLEADLPESEHGVARSALARFRGQPLDAPPGRLRASFDGPARAVRCATALAGSFPGLRAGVHTGECELLDGRLTGPALEIAAGVAQAAAAGRDPRHVDRRRPGRRLRDRVLRARRRRTAAGGHVPRVAPVQRRTLTGDYRAFTGGEPSRNPQAVHFPTDGTDDLHDSQRGRHAAAVRHAGHHRRPAGARRVHLPRVEPLDQRRAQPLPDPGRSPAQVVRGVAARSVRGRRRRAAGAAGHRLGPERGGVPAARTGRVPDDDDRLQRRSPEDPADRGRVGGRGRHGRAWVLWFVLFG